MKKAFRRILYVIASLIILVLLAIPIYLSYWRNSSTINTFSTFDEAPEVSFCKIKWTSDFLGEEEIEKIAFFVPVKIKGLAGNLFMQFDSGTQTTLLYGKTLNLLIQPTSSIQTFYNQDSLRYVKNPILDIADNRFHAEKIRIASSLGDEEIDSSFVVIGTIGFDIFVDRTLILDFKNDLLAITKKGADELPYSFSFIEGASVDKFPLLIPAKIGGKSTRLFYDTGSSMFSLLTSNKRLINSSESKADSLCCISNWGRQLPVYRKKLDAAITIGNHAHKDQDLYGCEVLDVVDYLPTWFLFGMTGNRLFDGKILAIDTKHDKFGIEY